MEFPFKCSRFLCEFAQPLPWHISSSELFNICFRSSLWICSTSTVTYFLVSTFQLLLAVHHIFLLSAKIASTKNRGFHSYWKFSDVFGAKTNVLSPSPSPIFFPPIPYSRPWFVFWLQKTQLSRRWWRLRRVWRRLAPSVYGRWIWKGFVLRKPNDQDCVWDGFGGWSRVFMGPASTPRTSSGGREASRPVVTAQIAGDHLLSERYFAKSDK